MLLATFLETPGTAVNTLQAEIFAVTEAGGCFQIVIFFPMIVLLVGRKLVSFVFSLLVFEIHVGYCH